MPKDTTSKAKRCPLGLKMGLGRTLWVSKIINMKPLECLFGRQWARIRTLRGHLGTIMAAKIHISVALGSTLGAHQAHCT